MPDRRPRLLSKGLTLHGLRSAALAPLVVCLLAATAQAQTAEDLVARNLAARGGAAALSAINTYVTKGELRVPGDFRLAFQETRERLDPATDNSAVRIDASLQGLTLIQAYDGQTGWRVNPFEGRKDAERMGTDEARALADEARIDGNLLSATARGAKVDYLGREDIDGTNTYVLRVTQPDGTVFTDYLDPDVYLEIRILERRTVRGAEQETEYDLGDYEKVNGVYFPFSIASGPRNSADTDKQVITIASGEANVPVSPALFAMPQTSAAASK